MSVDDFVVIPADSGELGAKKMRTTTAEVDGSTVHQETVQLADTSDNIINPATEETLEILKEKIPIDGVSAAIIGIDFPHHELHEGDSYVLTGQADLAADASFNIMLTTPDTLKYAHLLIKARASGEGHLEIFEGVTASNGGSTCTNRNRNRNHADAATTACSTAPTVTDYGESIYTEHFGAGKNIGGTSRGDDEIILKRNTKYIISIVSEVASNDMSWILDWYEHTNSS